MKKVITLALIATIAISCEETPTSIEWSGNVKSDYIIFGHFYGFCGGENCIEIFKLTPTELFEDTNDFYPSSEKLYDANFTKLDHSKHKKLNQQSFEIPSQLLNEAKTVIGAPDAADGGGIYLQLSDGRFWLIDMNESELPKYLIDLRNEIVSAIATINE